MKEYHKIQTLFTRDPKTKFRTLIEGAYSKPEFHYLQYNKWVFTEKVDGTNIRVMRSAPKDEHGKRHPSVTFGGKTDNASIPAKLIDRLREKFTEEKMEKQFPEGDICLYGEGYGAKIQKGGGNYRDDQDFVLFDVLIDGWWLERESVESIAEALEIDVVPIVDKGSFVDMVSMCKKGFKSKWGDFMAEGLVARPAIELKNRAGQRIITKLKHKDFYYV